MKIKAALTRVEADLLYDLITGSIGTYPLYGVICRRLPKYIEAFGKQQHEPLPYSLLVKEDWVMLYNLLNLSINDKKALVGYEPEQNRSLWAEIGRPLGQYLYSKGIPTE